MKWHESLARVAIFFIQAATFAWFVYMVVTCEMAVKGRS